MDRVAEEGLLGRPLHDGAQIHDAQTVADMLDHAQVVGDEQIGEVEFVLQIHENVQNLGLDGHVQGGYRLVGDDELGLHRQSPGDADALALAAGELMGVAIGLLGTEAYPLQQVDRLLLRLRFAGTQLVEEHRLGEDLHDLLAWVEGGIGVLEDHLHLPADGAHLLGLEAGDVTPVKRDLARLWLDELDDRTCRGGFAASGLAHQAEHLALLHVETDVVDRVDHLIL